MVGNPQRDVLTIAAELDGCTVRLKTNCASGGMEGPGAVDRTDGGDNHPHYLYATNTSIHVKAGEMSKRRYEMMIVMIVMMIIMMMMMVMLLYG